MTALELLEAELAKWTKALKKSTESYDKGDISYAIHKGHVENLEPKIKYWTEVIELFKKVLSEQSK